MIWEGEAPLGEYHVSVVHYTYHAPSPSIPYAFVVHIVQDGVKTVHHGMTGPETGTLIPVTTFQYEGQSVGGGTVNAKNMRVELHIL